jgi:hypothetical protein
MRSLGSLVVKGFSDEQKADAVWHLPRSCTDLHVSSILTLPRIVASGLRVLHGRVPPDNLTDLLCSNQLTKLVGFHFETSVL